MKDANKIMEEANCKIEEAHALKAAASQNVLEGQHTAVWAERQAFSVHTKKLELEQEAKAKRRPSIAIRG